MVAPERAGRRLRRGRTPRGRRCGGRGGRRRHGQRRRRRRWPDGDRPLGVLPLGTLNHFARDAGLPPISAEAVAAIAGGRDPAGRRGRGQRPDLRQQQRGRPLSVHGARARGAAAQARPKQAAGDARRQPARSLPLLAAPADHPDRRRPGADRDAFAVRRQQSLRDQTVRFGSPRGDRSRRALPLRAARPQPLPFPRACRFAAWSAGSTRCGISSISTASTRSRSIRGRKLLAVSTDGETWSLETPLRYRIRPGRASPARSREQIPAR